MTWPSALNHLAGRLGDADCATVIQHPEADLGRLVGNRVHQFQVRQMDRRFLLDDPAWLAHAGRLGVAFSDGDALHDGAIVLREDLQHSATAALIGPGDDDYVVAVANASGHYKTSGAREMIFMNFLPRSSRTTGPKMRVPIGSCCLLIRTAALRAERVVDTSARRTGNEVRTMTA